MTEIVALDVGIGDVAADVSTEWSGGAYYTGQWECKKHIEKMPFF